MVINWTELRTFEIKDAEITAPWLLLVETMRDSTHLQIKAEGSGTPMGGLVASCGPDGVAGLPLLPERPFVADCPVGGLTWKIGGSAASLISARDTPATPSPASEA